MLAMEVGETYQHKTFISKENHECAHRRENKKEQATRKKVKKLFTM